MAKEILIYGGSGRLGKAIRSFEPHAFAPDHKSCDITDVRQVSDNIKTCSPEVVINCAAIVGTRECETNKALAWQTNVEGAVNIARVCQNLGIRNIFISSAAIFDGKEGLYKESDTPSPSFYYAITKVAAEQAVRMTDNHVVVRLDFFTREALKYKQVFIDHFTSKIPVDEAAMKILLIAKSDYRGTVNIGRSRNSLYEILKPFFPEIEPIKIADSTLPNFPKDISLNLELFNQLFNTG